MPPCRPRAPCPRCGTRRRRPAGWRSCRRPWRRTRRRIARRLRWLSAWGFLLAAGVAERTLSPMATSKDDLILISVDDHIAEPADMFEAHVPEKYRDLAPRVVDEPDGGQQWYYGDVRGRNLGLNAVAGKPPEMFNVNPNRYEDMRPGC